MPIFEFLGSRLQILDLFIYFCYYISKYWGTKPHTTYGGRQVIKTVIMSSIMGMVIYAMTALIIGY